MCGINGIYQYENLDLSLDKVHKMNLISTNRGPDFKSAFHDEDIIFGHNRLAIIDLNKEANQPYISNYKSIILTYNGEIYNYQETLWIS